MGNGINKVLPNLYLGNIKDARDKELLAQHNISHILSIHDTAAPVLEDMRYLCISAADHSKQDLTQYFRESITFIHESRLKGEGCLVHCVAGVSRSVTLVVAYIMTVTGRGWVEALAAVRAARPCAGPNLGFLKQLEEFENMELKEYRASWKERYGNQTFNDEEELVALLTRKSTCSSSNAITTSITPAAATSRT
ncbi:dual specificity protein phosphatase 22-B-like [Platichthys flesus]|uniref:dual specificity protein phosphatase 22-B-like n=1 Tax=Platichthys flesus TaxID=8260 RepID=UPI002DBD792E|nr:dual specificity protein phosphatase 22-B-like [Platichthys flesus]XP_062251144.1 dual specificity protein phosphatase 22-B-like [Platichthys flesus]XP_062251145.1 dual specificity protein phosphatase 22-B-like [Platichthys flesus]XP_062251147.1 dual specificity protein phosphatase 22-B-like [Platichthys flesus]